MKQFVVFLYVRDAEGLQAECDTLAEKGCRVVGLAPAHGFSGYYYLIAEKPL